MECAMTAAQRGHEVIVLEKGARLGGQIWYGAGSPLRQSWARIADYYARQSRKGYFETRLNTTADAETVLALKPDAVVIATGSRPKRLEIPNGSPALTIHEALDGKADAARTIVIYDNEGFNRPGVVADYLSAQPDKTVIYVSPMHRMTIKGDLLMLEEMTARLQERGVTFALAEEIIGWESAGTLRLRNTLDASERLLLGVEVVIAGFGSESCDALADELRGHVAELHCIGDANEPLTVEQATVDGGTVARLL